MNGINGILFTLAVFGGVVMTWFQAKSYRKVADRVLHSNVDVAEKAVEADRATAVALNEIHVLVNSNLTAARQGELNATRITLATLRELADFKAAKGFSPSAKTTENIRLAEVRVSKLEHDLRNDEV